MLYFCLLCGLFCHGSQILLEPGPAIPGTPWTVGRRPPSCSVGSMPPPAVTPTAVGPPCMHGTGGPLCNAHAAEQAPPASETWGGHSAAGRVLPLGSATSDRPGAEFPAHGTTYHSALQVQRGGQSMCGLSCRGKSLERRTRPLSSPGHRLPSSQLLSWQMRPSRRRSANESRRRPVVARYGHLSADKAWSVRGRLARWAGAHACSRLGCT